LNNTAHYRGFFAFKQLFLLLYAPIILTPFYTVDNEFFQKQAEQCRNDRDRLRKSFGLYKGRPVILYTSKLTKRKRAMDLLEDFNSVAGQLQERPYLLFLGDGEMRSHMETRVQQLFLEGDVFFAGFRNQSELPCFYELCDVFVLPSFNEQWGLVINEAMNAGRAAIASDQVGGARDIIQPGKNGFVFEAGNIQALSRALIETLNDPMRCRDMGLASLKIISNWGFEEDIEGLKKAVSAVLSS
jgi:glycosyltransferase involved in cell wall biosynthesis